MQYLLPGSGALLRAQGCPSLAKMQLGAGWPVPVSPAAHAFSKCGALIFPKTDPSLGSHGALAVPLWRQGTLENQSPKSRGQ